jgi:dienelactone hydrolase
MNLRTLALILLVPAVCIAEVTVKVAPVEALGDHPVSIKIVGAPKGAKVRVMLTTEDGTGATWKSDAEYLVTNDNVLDLGSAAPVEGTYSGIDGMGLFWSMQPQTGSKSAFVQQKDRDGIRGTAKYVLSVAVNGRVLKPITILRHTVEPGVKRQKIRDKKLIGDLFYFSRLADDGSKHPAILVLGGSEGGLTGADALAEWYASHGYVAFAVAYFGIEPLPKNLIEIPIETVSRGIDYLSTRSFVDPNALAVSGISWGATFALAAAIRYPTLRAVIAWMGTTVLFPGLEFGKGPVDRSPFTFGGKPLPYITFGQWQKFQSGATNESAISQAFLPIERIQGPVLLIGGRDDKLGLSGQMADLGITRLREHKHPFGDKSLVYDDAGHMIFPGFAPTMNLNSEVTPYGTLDFGGTPKGYARANADCGSKVLDFLQHALRH